MRNESASRLAPHEFPIVLDDQLMAIEPRDNGLIASTLRMRDEVVNIAGALENIQRGKPDKKMIDIALRIIDQQEGEFDPDEFTDRYENALRSLIEEKKRGHTITRVAESGRAMAVCRMPLCPEPKK